MDRVWIEDGSTMDRVWIEDGSRMDGIWIEYGSRLCVYLEAEVVSLYYLFTIHYVFVISNNILAHGLEFRWRANFGMFFPAREFWRLFFGAREFWRFEKIMIFV